MEFSLKIKKMTFEYSDNIQKYFFYNLMGTLAKRS